jgi:hypothetical protein
MTSDKSRNFESFQEKYENELKEGDKETRTIIEETLFDILDAVKVEHAAFSFVIFLDNVEKLNKVDHEESRKFNELLN